MDAINTVIYFAHEWWNDFFHSTHERMNNMSYDELDRIYLQRKRFLFEEFGAFGFGEDKPVMDGKHVNSFVKWGMDIISYILGAGLTAQEAGGYYVHPMDRARLVALEPVDVAKTPFADWILRKKSELIKHYGSVECVQILETSLNVATRIGGQDFYSYMCLDKPFARHMLRVIAETTVLAYAFFTQHFTLSNVNLSNCSVNHISAAMYEELCLPNDVYLAEATKPLFPDMLSHVVMHNCDLPADRFVEHYAKVPHVYRLEASNKSDIRLCRRIMPYAQFCELINPVDMDCLSPEELRETLICNIKAGARELIFWSIDPRMTPERVRGMLEAIDAACATCGMAAKYDVYPFNFDEIEWSFPRWMGSKKYCINNP